MSLARFAVLGGVVTAMSAAALACSSSDDNGAPSNGPTADGGTKTDGGGTTNPDGTFSCTATPVVPVGALPSRTVNGMSQNDTMLFGLDLGSGVDKGANLKTGAIVKLPKAGGDVTTLYAPAAASLSLVGLLVSGDDVFTAEDSSDDTVTHKLLHISASTGAATTVATRPGTQDGFGDLVAVDDTSIYYFHGDSLYRQARAGGNTPPVEIANTDDGTFNAQVLGPDLYLTAGLRSPVVWRVPRNAASKADAVKLTDNAGCFGSVTAVEGGFYCASTLTLTKLGPDFAPAERVWDAANDLDGPTARLPRIVGRDGSKLFFSIGNAVTFRSFDIGASSSTIIGCGADGVLEGVVDTKAVYVRLLPAADGMPWPIVKIVH